VCMRADCVCVRRRVCGLCVCDVYVCAYACVCVPACVCVFGVCVHVYRCVHVCECVCVDNFETDVCAIWMVMLHCAGKAMILLRFTALWRAR